MDVAGNSQQQAQSQNHPQSRATLGARASLVCLVLLLAQLLLLLQPWRSMTMATAGANIIVPEMELAAEDEVAVGSRLAIKL